MSPITQVSSNNLVDSCCLEYNRQGFLALMTDTHESYCSRVQNIQNVYNQAPSTLIEYCIPIYDLAPSWVPVEYSNIGLRPWEAGCTWFFEDNDVPPTVQLRSSFEQHPTYLGIYNKQEVLSHEFVHAVRVPLESSAFEEIFAYFLSYTTANGFFRKISSGFRCALGPLFEHSWESLALVCLFMATLFLLLLNTFWESELLALFVVPMMLVSFASIGYLVLRLAVRWWQWLWCKKHLESLLQRSSLPLMVRLTDQEIIKFSRLSGSEIASFITDQSSNFRWQLLSQAYLKQF